MLSSSHQVIKLILSRIEKKARDRSLTLPSTHSRHQLHRSTGRHTDEACLVEMIPLFRSKYEVVQINHQFHQFVYHSVFHRSSLCTLQMIVHSRPAVEKHHQAADIVFFLARSHLPYSIVNKLHDTNQEICDV